MNDKNYFQFTLGPVQGFVSQARRTRDFWAGSFILSWLSAVAIQNIKDQKGTVEFPIPDENYMDWLVGKGSGTKPQQGGIPNRFKALTAEVPKEFKPEYVTAAVKLAWQKLANIIWENDLKKFAETETQLIWNRQVNNFWEISWVMSDEGASNLLDRRKNWRTNMQSSEPGHKCMMMDGWQELSGIQAINLKEVDKFWDKLRKNNIRAFANDIREGERLCAMALIKRRFSRYFDQVEFDREHLDFTKEEEEKLGTIIKGWLLPDSIPSVSFLAAAPWLAEAIQHVPTNLFDDFYHEASQLLEGKHNELASVKDNEYGFSIDIKSVKNAVDNRKKSDTGKKFQRKWAGLDGSVYFPTELDNTRNFENTSQLKPTKNALKAISEAMKQKNLQPYPSPYYAIILMDGDQLGKHMGDIDKQSAISNALNEFTQQAAKTVYEKNGFLIYAGGDDVLALFSMNDVLGAAAALQQDYLNAFKKYPPKNNKPIIDSTLSGAIQFVHIRTPLTSVLKDAHNLLDDVAKDHIGRNALAVRVWKPSGLALQWALPWEKVLDEKSEVIIEKVAKNFQALNSEKTDFSNKFFFRAREIVERLGNSLSQEQLTNVLMSEWRHSYGDYKKVLDEDAFKLLIEQSWLWKRPEPGKKAQKHNEFNPDTALLVRFLAQKGIGREYQ